MLAKVISTALIGLEAHFIEVEVDISGGLPQFSIVGLPDAIVRESRDRVRSALKNSGFQFPIKKITVNLAPAGLKKEGSGLDLAIALGILAAAEILPQEALKGRAAVGELSLDGRIKPIPGALSIALACRDSYSLLLPAANGGEAALAGDVKAYPCHTLPEVVEFLLGRIVLDEVSPPELPCCTTSVGDDDFADVRGQESAKRALEVAAAGGHNVLMIGPPGSGKTLLAKCIPSILPPLSATEILETMRIQSAVGQLLGGRLPLPTRPFRAPHHSISEAGFLGGGTIPHPGEVSLAHNGILFLDETPEFKRPVLEGLRQPLEEGVIVVTRVHGSVQYPARVMLVAAMNPCPCGFWGEQQRECLCTPHQIRRYRSRISGPLLDRLDIHLDIPPVPIKDLSKTHQQEASKDIRLRVEEARTLQTQRYASERLLCNAQLKPRQIKKYCTIDSIGRELLEEAMVRLGLSARAYGRILKVARTIADLAGSPALRSEHVAEAIQYRGFDRQRTV